MKIKEILKFVLPVKCYSFLQKMTIQLYFIKNVFPKKVTRQLYIIAKVIKYLSVIALVQVIKKKYIQIKWIFKINKKNIIWVGCFSSDESNIGDHAQTLAIEKFLQKHFSDYQVICFFRNEVGNSRWNRMVHNIGKNDLVFIHSSGDFGSRYNIITEKNIIEEDIYKKEIFVKKYSWHDIRKKIIMSFPKNPIIQLPTTVYYEDNEKGKKILEQDMIFYRDKNVMVLCRESQSNAILSRSINCKSRFFPDFVFYLKPTSVRKTRKGALLNLRTDSESKFNQGERNKISEMVKKALPEVLDMDAHKLTFPIIDLIRENYINSIFHIYQSREVIITDMMHGMIFAVINQTPCVVLDDAIPHKISAYKDILGKSVKFANNIYEIPKLMQEALDEPFQGTDLSSYFANFKKDILEEIT